MKAAALLILALSATGQQVSTKTWQTFTSKGGDFKIKAPKGWITSSLDNPASKAALAQIKAQNPNLAKLMASGTNTPYDLYILDTTGDITKGANNVNLKVIKGKGITQAMRPDIAKGIIQTAKLDNSGWKNVTLTTGPATTYWGTMKVAISQSQSMEVKMYGYLIVKGDTTYICSMGTSIQKDKKQKPIFDAMAQSISIK